MFIFEVTTCYDEVTLIITEDFTKAIDEKILDQASINLRITIWEDDKSIFGTKLYEKDENEINYDNIYVDLMKFIQSNK